jgi:hypothetical protein
MVKEGCWLPILSRMATCAILGKLPVVLVLVAAYTFARKPKIRVIQVLAGELSPRRGGNELRLVAFFACDTTMLSRKREARFAMIHSFTFGLPVDKSEVDSIVIGVTPSAFFSASAI